MSSQFLTFSSLYPNASQPGLGLFVEARLRQLLNVADYQVRVAAPVPWFPFSSPMFGKYGDFAKVPLQEVRYDIPIWHPRYFHLPKVAMNKAPQRIAESVFKLVATWDREEFSPQLVDAHYFFPEGVAAAKLAERLDLPLMITARGSDINLISQYPEALEAMRQAANRASAIIGVSSALAEKMVQLGFGEEKIHVLRNGVDTDFFCPGDLPGDLSGDLSGDFSANRQKLRQQMSLDQKVLLSVGNLIELKGHHLVIDAVSQMPDTTLLIAGSGPMESELRQIAIDCGVENQVRFLGQVTQSQLRDLYRVADALVLASSREGLANVLLESIACGNPVIATAVGGNPEVVSDDCAGILLKDRSAAAISDAFEQLEMNDSARQKTAKFAHKFAWMDTCHKLDRLIRSIM